jgi:hypothetical protein
MTNNYQTKYLKYKFKYLNLLNQSGGYEKEEFEKILNNPDENGYLMEIDKDKLLIDSISLSEIHKNNAIYIDKGIHDANSLSECIERYYLNNKKLATNPLNRNEYTEKDYNLIADHISGSGLDEELINKRKEIINEIKNLIQLDDIQLDDDIKLDIQKEILQLEPDKRKIFLNDHKFKIFIKFDEDAKKKLIYNINILNIFIENFNKYENYVINLLLKLNKEIQKEMLSLESLEKKKKNLKKINNIFITRNLKEFKLVINHLYNNYINSDNGFLFFIPEEYMTDEIIKLNGLALKYVPKDKITFEMCEIAIKENGLALEYVLADKMTDDEYVLICELAVQSNGSTLQYVLTDKMTDKEYLYICKLAVKQDGYVLKYVPIEKMTDNIIELAVTNRGSVLQFIHEKKMTDKMTDKKYLHICKEAIRQNGLALQYVVADKMTVEEYFNICRQAVEHNGYALQYVVADKMTVEEYFNICRQAVEENGCTLEYIPIEKRTDEIIKLAIQNCGPMLEFIPDNKKSPEIIKLAVKHYGLTLEFVPDNEKSPEIIKLALEQDGLALKYVPADKMTKEEYLNICVLAIQQTGLALKDVIVDKITKKEYLDICELAVKKYGPALNSVQVDNMTEEEYEYIYNLAVQNKNSPYYDYYGEIIR